MPYNEDYLHQLHTLVHLLDKLFTERPSEIKRILEEIDSEGTQMKNDKKSTPEEPLFQTKKLPKTHINSSDRIPIKQAKKFLGINFANIGSVEEWGEAMGYSKSYFWRKFEAYFRKPPQAAFIEKKKSVLVEFLKKNKDCKSREAARIIHLRDGNGLYQFVKRHFHCTPTQLKEKLKTEKREYMEIK